MAGDFCPACFDHEHYGDDECPACFDHEHYSSGTADNCTIWMIAMITTVSLGRVLIKKVKAGC
jgi:hypothetical protein